MHFSFPSRVTPFISDPAGAFPPANTVRPHRVRAGPFN